MAKCSCVLKQKFVPIYVLHSQADFSTGQPSANWSLIIPTKKIRKKECSLDRYSKSKNSGLTLRLTWVMFLFQGMEYAPESGLNYVPNPGSRIGWYFLRTSWTRVSGRRVISLWKILNIGACYLQKGTWILGRYKQNMYSLNSFIICHCELSQ